MDRVLVLGRGGAGKSRAALCLGEITGLPVIELDEHFWRADLTPTPRNEWTRIQERLATGDRWIMDGDLGPHDALATRLAAADTVLILDFSLARCAWRAMRRSPERADFWWWLVTWRRRSRPGLLRAVATATPHTDVSVLRTPRALRQFLFSAGSELRGRHLAP